MHCIPRYCCLARLPARTNRKDVDAFHPANMGRMLMRGRASRLAPCTPVGCMELLARSGINVAGRSAVIVGDRQVVELQPEGPWTPSPSPWLLSVLAGSISNQFAWRSAVVGDFTSRQAHLLMPLCKMHCACQHPAGEGMYVQRMLAPVLLPFPLVCSNTVGTPLAAMLRDAGAAAVTVCHRNSYQE